MARDRAGAAGGFRDTANHSLDGCIADVADVDVDLGSEHRHDSPARETAHG